MAFRGGVLSFGVWHIETYIYHKKSTKFREIYQCRWILWVFLWLSGFTARPHLFANISIVCPKPGLGTPTMVFSPWPHGSHHQKSGEKTSWRLVVHPIIYKGFIQTCQVVVWDFFHQQHYGSMFLKCCLLLQIIIS